MEIPGYYFDPLKNKYFKIQRNHIAPADSKYSVEAVKEQELKRQAGQIETQRRFLKRAQRIKHDRRIQHPLTSLQYRLGGNGPGSATSIVADYYGASIRPCPVLKPESKSTSHFAYGHADIVITAIVDNNRRLWHPMALAALHREPDSQGQSFWTTGKRGDIAQILGKVGSIMLTSNGLLAWTEDRGKSTTSHSPFSLRICCQSRSSPFLLEKLLTVYLIAGTQHSAQLHVAGLDDTTYEAVSHAHYSLQNDQKIQLSASPGGNYWAAWTSSNIFVRNGTPQGLDPPPTVLSKPPYFKKDDLLSVAFKDEWTLMAGYRSGFINFLDHRAGSETQVQRMRHDEPLNALIVLKDGYTVLASGMASTASYDLRYLAAPRTCRKSEPCTISTLRFSTQHISDRLELGLDYLPELNIVAIASSRNKSHHVNLYSTKTGRAISSALDRNAFDGPVPCLKFTYSAENGHSLLMAPETDLPKLTEWACNI